MEYNRYLERLLHNEARTCIAPSYSLTFDKHYFLYLAWKEKQPAIYHGHFAYMDIASMPVNRQTNVIYINMIRRPIDRYA